MRIQPIASSVGNSFRGKFETNPILDKIIDNSNEKDLLEFSLMLDVINNTQDDKIYFVANKKETPISPQKGLVLWCHEHWDSFPKAYRTVEMPDPEDTKQLALVLKSFTSILKRVYSVNFDSDLKNFFKTQIGHKLVK